MGAVHRSLAAPLSERRNTCKGSMKSMTAGSFSASCFSPVTMPIPSRIAISTKRSLQEIIDAPINIFPEQRIANTVAKTRARRWITQADELFDEAGGSDF